MEYPAQSHPDVLSLLCEGDSSTWDAKAWTFDEDALKAAPNKDHVPAQGLQHMSCCAYKRSRGSPEAEGNTDGNGVSCRAADKLADAPVTSCCAPLDISSFAQGAVQPDAGLQMNGSVEHHATENPNAVFGATYGLSSELPVAAAQSAFGPMGVAGTAANVGVTATGTAPPWFPQAPNDVPFMQSGMNMQGGSGENEVKTERPCIPPDAITLQTARKDLGPNRCWVVGCEKSVSDLREFHLRYHICDEHIRANCILRNGSPERFCQQCARFHSVELFDGNRRSCRVQLQKHNERRRKRTNPKAAEAAAAAAAQNASNGDDKDAVHKALHNGSSLDVANLNNFNPNQMPQLGPGAGGALALPKFPGVMNAMDMQALQLPDFSAQQLMGGAADMLGYGAAGMPSVTAGSVKSRDGLVQDFLQALMSNPSAALSLRRLMLSDSEGSNKISDARASHLSAASQQLANPTAPSATSNRTIRLSFKLLRCLPDDLPTDLKPQLLRWLDAAPTGLEGCIRPGCVMLTVQATVTMQNYARLRRLGLVSLVMHLLCSGCTFWHRVNMVVQAFNSVAICSKGKLISVQDVSAPALSASLPQLDAVSSHVLLSDGCSPLNLCLKGARLNTPGVSIIVRQGANCSLLTSTVARDASTTDIQIAVPTFSNGCAVVWVEAQMGGYLTQALPVLVCTGIQLAGHVHNISRDLVTRASAAPSYAEAHHWMLCNERLLMGVVRPFGIDAPPLWLCPSMPPASVLVPCNTPRADNNVNTSRGSSNGSCCGGGMPQLLTYDGPVLGVPVVDCGQACSPLEFNALPPEQQTPSSLSNCCASSLELLDVDGAPEEVQLQLTSSQSSQPENFKPCNAKAAPKACQCNVGSSFDAVREMLCQPSPLLSPGFDDGSDEEFAIFLDQLFPDIVAT